MTRFYGLIVIAAVALATTAAVAADKTDDAKPSKAMIERGKYLVNLGGCEDCHSPKNFGPNGPTPDPTRTLSGHPADEKLPEVDPKAYTPGNWILMAPDLTAYVGPWGTSYAANLTPDPQTGLGLWKPENFIQALRTGKHMGSGRAILPPMPWEFFRKVSDDDLKAIFAYLHSLPPIVNAVPAPVPPPAAGK